MTGAFVDRLWCYRCSQCKARRGLPRPRWCSPVTAPTVSWMSKPDKGHRQASQAIWRADGLPARFLALPGTDTPASRIEIPFSNGTVVNADPAEFTSCVTALRGRYDVCLVTSVP
ncbi:hypothetical protein MLPF_0783 [Mycobacterium lepromatosis]|nr:hypothetical protein MLPF_0783 [Mycobacterium lepromatosis]